MTRDPYMGMCIMPGCENYVTDIDPGLAYALNEINAKFPHVCQCHTKEAGGHDLAIQIVSSTGAKLYCKRKSCDYDEIFRKVKLSNTYAID